MSYRTFFSRDESENTYQEFVGRLEVEPYFSKQLER
jgi:hypothetical protein